MARAHWPYDEEQEKLSIWFARYRLAMRALMLASGYTMEQVPNGQVLQT